MRCPVRRKRHVRRVYDNAKFFRLIEEEISQASVNKIFVQGFQLMFTFLCAGSARIPCQEQLKRFALKTFLAVVKCVERAVLTKGGI